MLYSDWLCSFIPLPVWNVLCANLSSPRCWSRSPFPAWLLDTCGQVTFMAKRRAEDTLLHDSPSKIKRCRSLCGVELRLGSMAPVGGVSLSSPSLLALLGSRSRKRPYYFEDVGKAEEAALYHNIAHYDDVRKRAGDVSTMQTSGSLQERRSYGAVLNCKKRPREESDTISAAASDTVVEDASAEDCSYNSFQYWRSPLPDLDLSLLEDVSAQCPSKDKSKDRDFSLDAMET